MRKLNIFVCFAALFAAPSFATPISPVGSATLTLSRLNGSPVNTSKLCFLADGSIIADQNRRGKWMAADSAASGGSHLTFRLIDSASTRVGTYEIDTVTITKVQSNKKSTVRAGFGQHSPVALSDIESLSSYKAQLIWTASSCSGV